MKRIYISSIAAAIILGTTLNAQEIQITDDTSSQTQIAIDGDIIVYEDSQSGNDIYMYNLSTRETSLVYESGTWDPREIRIDGDTIVWIDYKYVNPNSYYSIRKYDIPTRTLDPDPLNGDDGIGNKYKNSLTIDGDIIVWRDYRDNSEYDIYMYDLSTEAETNLNLSESEQISQSSPHVAGNIIVWSDNRDVFMYDLTTPETPAVNITNNPSNLLANHSYTDGSTIVWKANDTSTSQENIYMYNISVGTVSSPLNTVGTAYRNTPKVDGDIIVWKDERNNEDDVYMYKISSTTETRVTSTEPGSSDYSSHHQIDGDKIVWMDRRHDPVRYDGDNFYDVYMYNASNGLETRLTSQSSKSSINSIDIHNKSIIWEDDRDGTSAKNVYLYRIEDQSFLPAVHYLLLN